MTGCALQGSNSNGADGGRLRLASYDPWWCGRNNRLGSAMNGHSQSLDQKPDSRHWSGLPADSSKGHARNFIGFLLLLGTLSSYLSGRTTSTVAWPPARPAGA